MDFGIVNSLITLLVGLGVFIVYWLQKRSEKKSAATIILLDIRYAEEVLREIIGKEYGIDVNTKEILLENNWSKYKHLFVSDFSHEDFAIFNRFFDSCAEISDARKRIRDIFYINLEEKVKIVQGKIFNIENITTADGQTKKKELIDIIQGEAYTLMPTEPRRRMRRHLELMEQLPITSAFNRLKKLAGG